jgi:uncharacterized protein (DUF885 family)
MIDRRRLFLSAAALAIAGPAGRTLAQTSVAGGGDAALTALMDRILEEQFLSQPEFVTTLGMDSGERASAKSRLDDRSQASISEYQDKVRTTARALEAIDRDSLSEPFTVHYDTLVFQHYATQAGFGFDYGGAEFPAPFVVDQLNGAYTRVPEFLDAQHTIIRAEDAEAYLARLSHFGLVLDQESERLTADGARGVMAPDFCLDGAIAQMDALLNTAPAELMLVSSLARRAPEAGLGGDWGGQAERITSAEVIPALRRQRDILAALRARATPDAGIWRLPRGEEYYDYALRFSTTTSLGADEIHDMGLAQVAELSARADEILRARGLTQGTVGDRLTALGRDPQHLYPNTDEAKEQMLAELNAQMRVVEARMPEYFGRLPRTGVEVRRVPKDIEAGAPLGRYEVPSLDGSRPGVYYINLRDTAEWPRWSLPTLTYHEATPGHHFQAALQQENQDTPTLMKLLWYSAAGEGWGLYAEQLADEIGLYDDNPLGRIGYLQSLLFRAARLVVDTGLHHKRWSREQAIRYMVEVSGQSQTMMTAEVDRYCVWPGQATSYKVGQTEWVRLRENARATLGDRFDIRGFHDIALTVGASPLTVVQRVIGDWVAGRQA